MLIKRKFILSILIVVVSGFLLMLSAGENKDAAAVVKMKNTLKFSPDTVKINVGETVLWKNTSLLMHTVTADSALAGKKESVAYPKDAEPFNSGNLDPEQTFKHTFTVPGTYKYFCIPHEAANMTGYVIVKPE